MAGFAQSVPGTALSLLDVLLFFKALADAVDYPSTLLRWLLQERLPAAWEEWVVERVRAPFDRAVREAVDHYIGRYRVGCHSLLGKDYSVQDRELTRLYKQAKDCAKAAHWYVMKTFIRSSEIRRLRVCRADPDASDTQVNHADRPRTIDWLELLEGLLRHPHEVDVPDGQTEPWWQPVIQNGWRRFPGFNNTARVRSADLPHDLVPSTRAERDRLVSDGGTMRSNVEQQYDTSA